MNAIVLPHAPGEYLHNFPGGVKLRHFKQMSCQHPIAQPPMPERLVLPLQQHIGDIAEPLVKPGQRVLKGEVLARPATQFGALLHASTSGTIQAIDQQPVIDREHSSGRCITLLPDREDEWHPDCQRMIPDWRHMPAEELIRRIAEAGIVGLGGAVFPTHRKLDSHFSQPIKTLILNGAECEPYISCDEMLMRQHPEQILLGSQILARALGTVEHIIIALEDQMGEVEDDFKRAQRLIDDPRIRICRVRTIYPEGGERQLIKVLTNAEVPSGGYPQQLGIVCVNVGTAWSVKRALVDRVPLIERVVTVSGAVNDPRNWLTLLGTPVSHLIKISGGLKPNVSRLVMGGPVMGMAIRDDAMSVTKGFNCLLAMQGKQLRNPEQSLPCINCSECVRVCPARLMPQMLYDSVRTGNTAQSSKLALFDCIECGCCDLVCPSHIPLTEYFRLGKSQLRSSLREQQRADKSEQRHQARDQRLEAQQQAREQRRAARKHAADDQQQAKQNIAAALARVRNKQTAKQADIADKPKDADKGDIK